MVVGLRNLKTEEADKLAYSWASRWVLSNFIGYKQTQYMFEKVEHIAYSDANIICINLIFQYSADELGGYGGGGEYTVQAGFGWSNGVILDFLKMYGSQLSSTAAGLIKPSATKPVIHI